MSVRIRQGGSLGRRAHAQLLEPPFRACQALLDLTQRLRTAKLTEDHRYELRPRAEPLRAPI